MAILTFIIYAVVGYSIGGWCRRNLGDGLESLAAAIALCILAIVLLQNLGL